MYQKWCGNEEKVENSLHYKLRACHTECQKAIVHNIKKQTDLRPGEPKILEYLAEHEPCEQKEIAAGCNLDSASVTGILRRMEVRGLIKREMKNGNRRSLYVSMTDKGRTLETQVEKTFAYVDSQAVKGLSEKEINEFLNVLNVINNNLSILDESTQDT